MVSAERINIAIADDHEIVRRGIIYVLETFKEFKVIIEAGDGAELINKIESASIEPVICILDISMPSGMNGYQTLKIIKKRWPHIHVIMLTQHYTEFAIIKTLVDKAACCLPKEISPSDLYKAITQVYKNGYYHSEIDSKFLTKSYLEKHKKVRISDNELKYLHFACSSLTHKQIASEMGVSIRTVDSYRDILCDRLGVKNRVELVVFALNAGIISMPTAH